MVLFWFAIVVNIWFCFVLLLLWISGLVLVCCKYLGWFSFVMNIWFCLFLLWIFGLVCFCYEYLVWFIFVMNIWFSFILLWISGLVWFGLVWFGLVWFGLVWFSLVWSGLVWSGLVNLQGLCPDASDQTVHYLNNIQWESKNCLIRRQHKSNNQVYLMLLQSK